MPGEAVRCHARSLPAYLPDFSLFAQFHKSSFLAVMLFDSHIIANMEETSAPPPRQQQTFRSTASTNWRMKDDSPRPDQQQRRTGYNRDRNDKQGGNSQTYSRNSNFQQSSDEAAGTRLYVGNLLYSAQRSDIEELFTGSGCNVVNISISTDPFSGRNPSYCFVDLESAEEAQRAMSELNGVDFMGRSLRVSPGVAKRQVQGSGAGRGELRTRDYEGGQRRPRGTRDVREQRGKLVSLS